MARRALSPATGGTVVLDAEGVVKAAAGDERVQARLTVALRRQARVVLSAATLAEVLRGGRRDAAIHRVLSRIAVLPLTADLGRAAGELLGSSGMPGRATVDSMVAATALVQPGPVVVLTSDPGDLRTLTAHRPDISVAHV